ncbi:hypothetical protein ACTNDG_11165 [Clostridium sp. HCP1S3_B4]|nr:hypothetical protein [Clostridiales bacterium]MDY2729089.1 hypothetical protein [Clostridium sp.]
MKENNKSLQEELKNLKLEKRRLLLLGKKTDKIDESINKIEIKLKNLKNI